MREITSRSAPYSSIVYVQTVFADGYAIRGSGSVVGNNDVLTAEHMVYSASHGGYATQVMVAPGAFINAATGAWSAPKGTYMATDWSSRVANWDANGDGLVATSEAQYDMALLSFNVNLGALTGILPTSNQSGSFAGTVLGYPGKGTGLMEDTGTATPYSRYGAYDFSTGLGQGASGGPLLDANGNVRGVLSSGDTKDTYSTYGSLADASNWSWLTKALVANDYLTAGVTGHLGLGVNNGSEYREVFLQSRLSLNDNHQGSVYGYGGGDTLFLNQASTAYKWSAGSNAVTLTSNSGDLALDLHDVNLLDFSDRDLYVLTSDQAQIARLYNAAFHRVPDFSGLNYWMYDHAKGTTSQAIAQSFTASSEFKGLFSAADDRAYVTQLYANVLGRTGETAGIDYWLHDLGTGLGRANVLQSFSDSAENQALTTGANGFILLVGQSEWA